MRHNFFEGKALKVTSQRNDIFIVQFYQYEVNEKTHLHDESISHMSKVGVPIVNALFPNLVISGNTYITIYSLFSDLTVHDFFLCLQKQIRQVAGISMLILENRMNNLF